MSRFVILALLVMLTLQVDIDLIMDEPLGATITCTNIPPGYCCLTPMPLGQISRRFPTHYPSHIFFRALHTRHLAVAFEARGNLAGCDAIPPARKQWGPGSFLLHSAAPPPRATQFQFTGASYVTLPNTVEADEYHAVQGLMGLATADRSWSAPGVGMRNMPGFGSNFRRDIIDGQRGIAYIGPPPHSRYPDVITINSAVYRSTNTSALTFRSESGQILNTSILGF